MRARFAARQVTPSPNNLRQVRVPAGATVLANGVGMAPGFQLEHPLAADGASAEHRAQLFFLPGVPREMKPMFQDEVVPRLRALAYALPQVLRPADLGLEDGPGTDARLAVLPAGTANLLASGLHLPADAGEAVAVEARFFHDVQPDAEAAERRQFRLGQRRGQVRLDAALEHPELMVAALRTTAAALPAPCDRAGSAPGFANLHRQRTPARRATAPGGSRS